MTNAQHLIENAIMHLCRTGKLLETDVNESHCSCTLEDANDMAQHIVWSLYNGLSPNDVDRLQEERDAAISAIERTCKYCKHGASCDDYDCITDRVDNWEWCGIQEEKHE